VIRKAIAAKKISVPQVEKPSKAAKGKK
jgi:hypothetical protein